MITVSVLTLGLLGIVAIMVLVGLGGVFQSDVRQRRSENGASVPMVAVVLAIPMMVVAFAVAYFVFALRSNQEEATGATVDIETRVRSSSVEPPPLPVPVVAPVSSDDVANDDSTVDSGHQPDGSSSEREDTESSTEPDKTGESSPSSTELTKNKVAEGALEAADKTETADASQQVPEWVGIPQQTVDRDLLITVSSDPRLTLEEAQASVRSKLEERIRADWMRRHPEPKSWEAGLADLITDDVIRDRFDEIRVFEMGGGQKTAMHIVHWRVALTPQLERNIEAHWKSEMSKLRMLLLGGLCVFLTICAGTTSGVIRARSRLQGRYGATLTLGGLAVVAGAGGAIVVAMNHFM